MSHPGEIGISQDESSWGSGVKILRMIDPEGVKILRMIDPEGVGVPQDD